MFAIRMSVLLSLKADPVWRKRALECRCTAELHDVFVDFAKLKGYKVRDVGEGVAC